MNDAHAVMFDWLRTCEQLQRSMYAVFGKEASDSRVFIPLPDPRYISRDVLGNETRWCTVALINYKAIQEIPAAKNITPENIDSFIDVQGVIDWVWEQNDSGNLPDFGEGTRTDEVYTLMASPELSGYNNTTRTARYAITIRAEYTVERK